MSVARSPIGGSAIAFPSGTDESASNGKVPPKRRTYAKPDLALQPEPR